MREGEANSFADIKPQVIKERQSLLANLQAVLNKIGDEISDKEKAEVEKLVKEISDWSERNQNSVSKMPVLANPFLGLTKDQVEALKQVEQGEATQLKTNNAFGQAVRKANKKLEDEKKPEYKAQVAASLLHEQIKSGVQLKHVETPATSAYKKENSHEELLKQIKSGVKLKRVEQNDKPKTPPQDSFISQISNKAKDVRSRRKEGDVEIGSEKDYKVKVAQGGREKYKKEQELVDRVKFNHDVMIEDLKKSKFFEELKSVVTERNSVINASKKASVVEMGQKSQAQLVEVMQPQKQIAAAHRADDAVITAVLAAKSDAKASAAEDNFGYFELALATFLDTAEKSKNIRELLDACAVLTMAYTGLPTEMQKEYKQVMDALNEFTNDICIKIPAALEFQSALAVFITSVEEQRPKAEKLVAAKNLIEAYNEYRQFDKFGYEDLILSQILSSKSGIDVEDLLPKAMQEVNDVRPKSFVASVSADRGQKQISAIEQWLCEFAITIGVVCDFAKLVDFTLGYVDLNSKTLDVESICMDKNLHDWNASQNIGAPERAAKISYMLKAEQLSVGLVR